VRNIDFWFGQTFLKSDSCKNVNGISSGHVTRARVRFYDHVLEGRFVGSPPPGKICFKTEQVVMRYDTLSAFD